MPTPLPKLADRGVIDLARTVAAVYEQAEDDLVAIVAAQVAKTTKGPQRPGARAEAEAVARVAAGARKIVARLDRLGVDASVGALTKAQDLGIRKAERELGHLVNSLADDRQRQANTAALAAWSRGLVDNQRQAHRSILRTSRDAYRDVIARVYGPKVSGAEPKRTVLAQRAMDEFAARGITEFRDRSGRRWELSTYVEMATRTAGQRAMIEGQIDRLEAGGRHLFIVSDNARECPLCRPWEGKVLTRGGTARVETHRNLTGGADVEVTIAGSLAEAMAAGLFHPNCTHGIAAYIPGATRQPVDTEDPQGYDDRQRLRELERGKRKAAKRKAAALDKATKRDAAAEVKAWDDAIVDHLDRTGLIRQPDRERPDLGLKVGRADPHRVAELAQQDRDAAARARTAEKARRTRAEKAATKARREAAEREAAARAEAEQHARAEAERVAAEGLEAERVAAEQALADEAARAALEAAPDDDLEPTPALEAPDDADPVDPGGDPADLDDEQLEGALSASLIAEDFDRFEVLSAESDGRDARRAAEAERRERKRQYDADRRARQRAEREAAKAAADEAAWARAEQLIEQGWGEEHAVAEAFDLDPDDVKRQNALSMLRGQGYTGRSFADVSRQAFEEYLEVEYIRAEDAVRGHMLNPQAQRRGIDPKSLLYGTEARARKHASEELLAYWDENGRYTLEDYRTELLEGRPPSGRSQREDYLQ